MATSARARSQFQDSVRLTDRLTNHQLAGILRDAADQIGDLVEASTGEGVGAVTRRRQLKARRGALSKLSEILFDQVETVISDGVQSAWQLAADHLMDFEFAAGLGAAEVTGMAEAMSQWATEEAVESLVARRFNGLNLSERVYRGERALVAQVNGIVDRGLLQGLSPRQLAAQVRGFISPTTPGGVSYAAMRLARTEVTNAYHHARIKQARGRPWIDEFQWNLSSSHGRADACNLLAERSPYSKLDVPAKPHPQCLCFVTPVLPDTEEFLRRLNRGEFDDFGEQVFDQPLAAKLPVSRELEDLIRDGRKRGDSWSKIAEEAKARGLVDVANPARIKRVFAGLSDGPIDPPSVADVFRRELARTPAPRPVAPPRVQHVVTRGPETPEQALARIKAAPEFDDVDFRIAEKWFQPNVHGDVRELYNRLLGYDITLSRPALKVRLERMGLPYRSAVRAKAKTHRPWVKSGKNAVVDGALDDIRRSVAEFADEYPEQVVSLKKIQTGKEVPNTAKTVRPGQVTTNTYAQYWPTDRLIDLSPRYFDQSGYNNRMPGSIASDCSDGFHPGICNHSGSVFEHEFGHHMDYSMTGKQRNELMHEIAQSMRGRAAVPDYEEIELIYRDLPFDKKHPEGIGGYIFDHYLKGIFAKTSVSRYANTNSREFLAELFSAMRAQKHGRRHASARVRSSSDELKRAMEVMERRYRQFFFEELPA